MNYGSYGILKSEVSIHRHRFIPNGFPDKKIAGEQSDILFTDHQARRGHDSPLVKWETGQRIPGHHG